jgi:hypothetical protein
MRDYISEQQASSHCRIYTGQASELAGRHMGRPDHGTGQHS